MANQKTKIVIIDDEISFLDIFSKALENAGFEIKGFSDSKKALVEIPKENPDLILLDISMPELNGFEFLKQIKADYFKEGNAPRVVFLTNLGETDVGESVDGQYAKSIGAQGYIKKTDDLNNVIEKIKEVLK